MDIEKILNELTPMNIVFLILAVLGILATIYFYLRSIKRKEPTYSLRNIVLMKDHINKIDGLEINYNSRAINNLSISKIAFFNNGKETIKGTDVANADRLRIEVNGEFEILNVELLFQKNLANNFRIEQNDNNILISFDYCDFGEGCVLQLMHTGNSIENIKVKGSIQGVKKLKLKSLNNSLLVRSIRPLTNITSKYLSLRGRNTFLLAFLFIVPVILLGILLMTPTPENKNPSLFSLIFPGIFAIILYWGLAISIILNRLPKGFNTFTDEYLSERK